MNAIRLSRRTVLRGLGTAMALPWLEAMAPSTVRAAARAAAGSTPKRLAFLYVPNGVRMEAWTPKFIGDDYELPPILAPLASLRNDVTVLTGLAQDNAHAKGDGGGDHARSLASFLTGTHPYKTDGANLKAGVSVDQLAAQKIGQTTRFASLEMGCDRGAQSGACDTGYSCAYSSNISWRSESTPVAKEINPRLVFERLFASDAGGAAGRRNRYRASILDFVAEDARQLQTRLGSGDRRKLDEYFTGVREIERRIAGAALPNPDVPDDFARPTGVPKDYAEHISLMLDLMVLAFQGDVTRISTFMYANEGSNRSYPFIGVPEGHHDISHHGRDPVKNAKIQAINTFHVAQLARFLSKLKAIPEGNSTVLDNSMIVYGSGIGDGDRHNHNDLPVLLAGGSNLSIRPGRHVVYPKNTPMNNLYLSMLQRVGVEADRLGDSTGHLGGLDG
jgi:hypothetical protein